MKSSSMNPREKLGDVTNVPRADQISVHSKEYIDKLHDENMALKAMVAERNKIIEITGAELQKMRVHMQKQNHQLQKLQQQNHKLAVVNTQMLADLNSGNERRKLLHHELGCKNALLFAKKLEAEGMAKENMCQQLNDEVKPAKCKEAEDSSFVNTDKDRPTTIKRRHRSKSLGSSVPEDMAENKRLCVRSSARLKHEEPKLDEEDSFEVKEDRCPPMVNLDHQNCSTSVSISPSDLESSNPSSRIESKEFRRSSLSRPPRQAAGRVKSYKEIPLNVKMRREA